MALEQTAILGAPNMNTRREVDIPVEINKDENIILVIGGKVALEAIEDKILILLDKFRSGYECKDCNETGVYVACQCIREGRGLGVNANGKRCVNLDACEKQEVGTVCRSCKGTGSLLALPDQAKQLPTTGTIVSKGPACTKRKIGERVIFGAHTGYFIPFKGNAKIRCMREDEPLCIVHSVDTQIILGDFMQIDEKWHD